MIQGRQLKVWGSSPRQYLLCIVQKITHIALRRKCRDCIEKNSSIWLRKKKAVYSKTSWGWLAVLITHQAYLGLCFLHAMWFLCYYHHDHPFLISFMNWELFMCPKSCLNENVWFSNHIKEKCNKLNVFLKGELS